MIINYTATSDSRGKELVQSYSQRLLSPVLSSKESSLTNLYLADLSKQQKSHSIKKELALRVIKGHKNFQTSRSDIPYSNPLGPGYYNCSYPTPHSPTVNFSNTYRTIIDMNPTKISLKCPEIISSNKNVQKFLPDIKKDLDKIKFKEKTEKISKVRNNKVCIVKEKKKKFNEKIEEKRKKFQRLQQKEFYMKLEISWFTLMSAVNMVKAIKYKISQQKGLHLRAQRYLKAFCLTIKAIGIFLRMVWKYRTEQAKKKLSKLVGVVKLWVKHRRTKYRYISLNFLETFANKDRLNKLMYKWKSKILLIQRRFRQILLENKITWSLWMLRWNIAENKVSNRRKSKALTKIAVLGSLKKKGRVSLRDRGFSIIIVPQEIKCFYIKEFFKNRIKEFIYSMKVYRETCKNKIEEYKQYWYLREAAAARGDTTSHELVLPEKPKPNYDLNDNEMKKIVFSAYEKIDTWEGIVRESEARKRRIR